MGRKNVLVIDNAHRTAASLEAAGIMNPITGKRLNRPVLMDRLLEDAFGSIDCPRFPSVEAWFGGFEIALAGQLDIVPFCVNATYR